MENTNTTTTTTNRTRDLVIRLDLYIWDPANITDEGVRSFARVVMGDLDSAYRDLEATSRRLTDTTAELNRRLADGNNIESTARWIAQQSRNLVAAEAKFDSALRTLRGVIHAAADDDEKVALKALFTG